MYGVPFTITLFNVGNVLLCVIYQLSCTNLCILHEYRGLGSSVGIAIGYGLDGAGIESQWGRDFLHLSRPALGPTQPPVQWVPGLPGVKSGRGVTLTPHPLLEPWSWKSRAIPLLPLWASRPVQSLSACTRGALYLYTSITLYHVIYSVRYYPCFHVTAVGLGMYYQWIRGSACI